MGKRRVCQTPSVRQFPTRIVSHQDLPGYEQKLHLRPTAPEAQTCRRCPRRSLQSRQQSQRTLAISQEPCPFHGNDRYMADRPRTLQSIRTLERACSRETNRLVRIRMLGGVGGSRSNAGPFPIPLFCAIPRASRFRSIGHSNLRSLLPGVSRSVIQSEIL